MVVFSHPTPSNQIGTLKEKSLHAELKNWLKMPGDKIESPVDGYIIDIVREELLIEIQTQNFSAIRKKLENLLKCHRVRLIYPIVQNKWIICLDRNGDQITKRRLSPKHNSYVNIFEELVRIPHIVLNSNLIVEALIVNVEETRLNDGKGSWRRRGVSIKDRKLIEVIDRKIFHDKSDFLGFLPCNLGELFTNENLAKNTGLSIYMARKITYCLRKMGAIMKSGKKGKKLLFMRARTL